jgi:predicted dehydrogenase/threonine dehydrogenase-like Zn-dependent dehydrogenase
MKQVQQNLRSGATTVVELPCPQPRPGHLLIRSRLSLISSGTERSVVSFGQAGLIGKARAQPERVRMVLGKMRTDGVLATWEAVRSKLDQPLPLGYCNVGTVVAVGAGVSGFSVGDRVVSNGNHAEVVLVPKHLVAHIPDTVRDVDAVYAVLGAIALQGLRLADPTLGEVFAVFGLGLVGQMAVQLLKAQGCRVLAIDPDPERLRLAAQAGAETVALSTGADPLAVSQAMTDGRGLDGVLLTASTTSSEPVHQAAQMCRKRGRIVLVGVTGLELMRSDFYEKELRFQVSCSYGPGRYDPEYEVRGHDYPIGFVRWTEQRNLEAVLALMAEGRIQSEPLISHCFPIEDAEAAYRVVLGSEPSLGILLDYGEPTTKSEAELRAGTVAMAAPSGCAPGGVVVGLIGAGAYATRMLLPGLRASGATIHTVASRNGWSGTHASRLFRARYSTTDSAGVLANPELNAVVIATRHDSHADLVCGALRARKHVFVEKPLAIAAEQLAQVQKAYCETRESPAPPLLMVGFNRRFAPQVVRIKSLIESLPEPKAFILTVNAGALPPGHWTQNPEEGGGRIVGEGCHFIDLLRFLAGAPVIGVQTTTLGKVGHGADKVTFVLRFGEGSMGTVHYLANGHAALSKERLEVFCAGRVLALDNFRTLRGYGWPVFRRMRSWRQDKGNHACIGAFVAAVRQGRPSPIPADELFEVTRISLEVAEATRN